MLTTPADEFGLGLGLPPLPPSPQDLMGQALTTTRDSLAAALPARSRSNHLVLAEVPTDQARQLATRLADALDPIADMLSWARRCLHDSDTGPLNPCDQATLLSPPDQDTPVRYLLLDSRRVPTRPPTHSCARPDGA